jgi:hypothetical protein
MVVTDGQDKLQPGAKVEVQHAGRPSAIDRRPKENCRTAELPNCGIGKHFGTSALRQSGNPS